jgi:hypothetical protein
MAGNCLRTALRCIRRHRSRPGHLLESRRRAPKCRCCKPGLPRNRGRPGGLPDRIGRVPASMLPHQGHNRARALVAICPICSVWSFDAGQSVEWSPEKRKIRKRRLEVPPHLVPLSRNPSTPRREVYDAGDLPGHSALRATNQSHTR